MGRAEEKAKRILGDKGGSKDSPAPRGKRGRPKLYANAEEKRAARREREGKRSEDKSSPTVQPEPTEADVRAYGFMGATIWRLLGPMVKLRALTDEESMQLGAAIAPVAMKYGNALGAYAPEFALVVTVAGLYFQTKAKGMEGGEVENAQES